MTVKIMGGEATLEAPLPVKENEREQDFPGDQKTANKPEQPEKPAVFMPETDSYITSVRHSAGRSRKSGLFGVVFAQLVITTLIGVGLWAACALGIGQAGEICERLVQLFR